MSVRELIKHPRLPVWILGGLFVLVGLIGVFTPLLDAFDMWGLLFIIGGLMGIIDGRFLIGLGLPNEIVIEGCVARTIHAVFIVAGIVLLIVGWPVS